ncbi:MAG: hypothetical protein KF703_07435 [Actinobacteria bacterium]|nr:hypothetical protein [Actinomycetota bacterium]
MCFSAEASFIGAAVVGTAGVGALVLADEPRQVPFAALPLLFGIHQALEGWTWVSLDDRSRASLSGFGVHTWVLFAWAFLPVYVPWAVRLIEPIRTRRRWMSWLAVVGAGVSAYMFSRSIRPEVTVSVVQGQLDYHLGGDVPSVALAVPYVAATCLAPILSTHRWVRAFGAANAVALAVAALMAIKDFSSIWCTFAAFLSLLVVAHQLDRRQREGPDRSTLGPAHTAADGSPVS